MNSQRSLDEIIYTQDFQLAGPHLIEASAGTGKTYSIQNIYARLVMEKGFRVSEIQVMTFTEAATKELRERLHRVLKDLQCRFAAEDCPGKTEKETFSRNQRADQLIQCAAQVTEKARAGVELALLEFDNAAISTIHGFCRRVLAKYAFDTGVMLSPEIGNDKSAQLNMLAEDWWRKPHSDAPQGIDLALLKNFVQKLSGKSIHLIDPPDVAAAEGYLLLEAEKIVREYEKDAVHREKMNFDDLLLTLRNALLPHQKGSARLIARLQKEFKAALIDEFQDTDPVQYEIFERIFRADDDFPLFFVGDPKQAIYSFRGGDIFTYLKAKRSLTGHFSLTVNHRSTENLVNYANRLFHRGVFGCEAIENEAEVSVGENPATKGPADLKPLHVVAVDSADSDAWIDQLLAILDEKNPDGSRVFKAADIAILTNSNDRNAQIREKLKAKNIPGVIRNTGNVFSSPMAAQFRTFLVAVAYPERWQYVSAALFTVFGGKTFAEIPSPGETQAMAAEVKRFLFLQQLWRSRGLASLVARLEQDDYRQRLAQSADGERLLSDIDQIIELSFAAVRELGPSIDKFLSWFGERINNATAPKYGNYAQEKDESKAEEYARELESDEDAVKIMTIHASKGLQFPVVFLPLPGASRAKDEGIVSYHDEEDALHFCISPNAAADREIQQERIRVMYVAMTRAIERMVVAVPAGTLEQSARHIFDLLEIAGGEESPYELKTSTEIADAAAYFPLTTAEAERETPLFDRKFDLSLYRGSYSALAPATEELFAGDDGKDDDQSDRQRPGAEIQGIAPAHEIFTIPCGAAVGNFWHGILEKLPFDADDGEIRRAVQRRSGGVFADENFQNATCRMLRKVLDHPLAAPDGQTFSLREVAPEHRLSEQEFNFSTANVTAQSTTQKIRDVLLRYWQDDSAKTEFLLAAKNWDRPLPRGFMTGFIDLIFQYGDYYYVVDWKSNTVGGEVADFDEPGIRQEMAKHGYFFQYLLYCAVLHRHLKQMLQTRYSWEKNFGGARYYFLRGIASGGAAPVFADRPPEKLLDELGTILGLEK